jgi:hypothetical protein
VLHCGSQWRSATDFATSYSYLFSSPPRVDESSKIPKKLVPLFTDPELVQSLSLALRREFVREIFENNKDSFNHDTLQAAVENASKSIIPEITKTNLTDEADAQKLAMLCVHYFLRLWLAGGMSGPRVVDLMLLLGKEESEKRLLAFPEQIEVNSEAIASTS